METEKPYIGMLVKSDSRYTGYDIRGVIVEIFQYPNVGTSVEKKTWYLVQNSRNHEDFFILDEKLVALKANPLGTGIVRFKYRKYEDENIQKRVDLVFKKS
jgi:hypothetical protein